MPELSEHQINTLTSMLSNNYLIGDCSEVLRRDWKKIPEIFTNNLSLTLNDIYDKLIEEYPDLTSYVLKCDLCDLYYGRRNRTNVLHHPNLDQFEEPVKKCICQRCSRNFTQWRDGTFHNVREPRISRYHGNDRNLLFDGVDFHNPRIMGLELETYIEGSRRDVILTAQTAESLGGLFAEEDGSLDRQHGAEFVFKPYTLDEIVEQGPVYKVVDFLANHGAIGWKAGIRYGIHISINAKMMTALHAAKFCYFINRNPDFCELVGGRIENGFAEYKCSRLSGAGLVDENKYFAAARRSPNRIEVRMFRSTLNWKRVRRNFEFVDSVREYTKFASMQSLTPRGYAQYLKQTECHHVYKNMRDLLGLNGVAAPDKQLVLSLDM